MAGDRLAPAALWPALLTGAGAATTLALACATPFSALAALAATRMRGAAAAATVAAAWTSSQLIGFCVLGYPRDATTLAWGAAMLTAALAALAAARWGGRQAAGRVLPLLTAYGTGFVAYKAVLLAWSLVLGGVHTALSPYWTARQFGREALILCALALLCRALVALGVPPAPIQDVEGKAWA